jgi:ABC-2 type transport system ATP-binding protein
MPDFFGVYEDMLVWEYLDFFGRCYGLPARAGRQVIGELLELVDLSEKRDAYVHTLSRGCASGCVWPTPWCTTPGAAPGRAGFGPRSACPGGDARAAARAGIDGKNHHVSSHILTELAELCDSVGIIEKGRLVVSAGSRRDSPARLAVPYAAVKGAF